MRIHFPGSEHAHVSLDEGALRIGSGPEADLRLTGVAALWGGTFVAGRVAAPVLPQD